MNKIFSFILFFSVLTINVTAQGIYASLFQDISLGSDVGITHFQGDISETDNLQPAFAVHIDKGLDDMLGMQFELITGKISGKNYFTGTCDNTHHITDGGMQVHHERQGEKFDAEFIEFDVNYLINISVLMQKIIDDLDLFSRDSEISSEKSKLNVLAKFGVGINIFRTVRTELQDDVFINSYGYEWLWENNFNQAGIEAKEWNKSIREGTVLYGLIVKYNILDYLDIDLSVSSRLGIHDKWDAKLSQRSDAFLFYSLGTTVNL